MSQLIFDLFFAVTFVLLLYLLAKIRERIFIENKVSYRYALSGVFVFCVVSVLQLAGHQGLFDLIPLLSEPIYLEVIKIIGIIAGITLLVAGVSVWIPSRRKKDTPASKPASPPDRITEIILKIIATDNITGL
ncbi:MAG: hypothetical protein JSV44_04580, partial [Candidatus Zixiibacteriota bacterium]